MVIEELNTRPSYKLARILNVLESAYGLTIDFEAAESLEELETIYEAYGELRNKIITESSYNSQSQNADYTKAVLIQEAIHIFLSEVAPKRMNRKKKKTA